MRCLHANFVQLPYTQTLPRVPILDPQAIAAIDFCATLSAILHAALPPPSFIAKHLIRLPERAVDDVAGTSADMGAARAALGLS